MTDETFEQVARRYGDMLYRVAYHALRVRADAEDVAQTVLLRLYQQDGGFESEEHLKHWLLRVTVNGCKSRLRSPWRRRTAPLLETYPAAGPEEQELLEIIQTLPARDRAVLHLYYYEGYRTAEIAAMTGWREGTVRSRLARARGKLGALLKGDEP